MHFTTQDISDLDRIYRLNLINSISGIKPANLIGSSSKDAGSNLAIFSSVVHIGSNPPMMAFVLRPHTEVRRHTYDNIRENGYYTINHVHESFIGQAHYTSAKFDREVSEFDACQLTEEFLDGFPAPYVKESAIKIGLTYEQSIPIPVNDTVLVVGTVKHLYVPDAAVNELGQIDLAAVHDVGISGLNTYYGLNMLNQFPYARVHETPDFNSAE